ncbi:hypothetical protein DV737_g4602, partial [Chaetothyriales sp. CBS 132003]
MESKAVGNAVRSSRRPKPPPLPATRGNAWATALVSVGCGQQKLLLLPEVRLCDRIPWGEPAVAAQLLARIVPHLPAGEAWAPAPLNQRLRFLQCSPGMCLGEHCDGCYVTMDGNEVSVLTVYVNLKGSSGGDKGTEETELKGGGAPRFMSWDG